MHVSPYSAACIYVYIVQKRLYAGLPNKRINERFENEIMIRKITLFMSTKDKLEVS